MKQNALIAKMVLVLIAIFSFTNTNAAPGALNFKRDKGSFVDVGILYNGGHSYTKEAWIKANANTTHNIITGGDDPFWLHGGKLRAANRWQGGNPTIVEDSVEFPLNTWVHVAVTFDSATKTMRLYKNGVEVAYNTNAETYLTSFEQIGAFNDGNCFDGDIDEARIWDRALCAPELNQYMNVELKGNEPGLKAYFQFNEGNSLLSNLGITKLVNKGTATVSGALKNFSLTGSVANFVDGVVFTGQYSAFVPPAVSVSSSVSGVVTTLTATSAAKYQWMKDGQWLNGVNSQSYSAEIGTYSVMITAANGCTNTSAPVTVVDQNPIVPVVVVTPETPVGGQEPETIYDGYGPDEVVVGGNCTGGTPPYTYEWEGAEDNTPNNNCNWGYGKWRGGGTSKKCYDKAPKVKPNSTTCFKLKVTDAKGRCKTISKTIKVKSCKYGYDKVMVCLPSYSSYSGWSYKTYAISSYWVPLYLYLGGQLGGCADGKGVNTSGEVIEVNTLEFTTFPNPTTGLFTVTLPEPGNSEIVVIDLNGKMIARQSAVNSIEQKMDIDLTAAPAGMYFVKVMNNDKSYSAKIVKQ